MTEQEVYEYLKEYLEYNPDTGKFIWIKIPKYNSKAKIGCEAGSISTIGYRQHNIKGKNYKGHRLAWLYMTGSWPADQIDHINGIRDDNRWVNLREATHSQNAANSKRYSTNSIGYKGVYRNYNKWIAQISINGKVFHIGRFNTAEEAARAYDVKAKELQGDFAVLNFISS